ncbi:MFS transporter [Actinosynnema sp. NPDC047251]|uniref:Permease, MFS-type n=1 Tax=Saccharothrix espanaensis (strain ATCC 51144 / DSM 44229 / JCM 9112 / NBRC 15066 / NRRL 15764) TaxID=1179773 RepID=K0JR05_SACES|nr:MFS transporter [Saccharothrix espanaensis]CCH27627.1 Permease, MFS-type [Saccharothrix espanaensis DSM 44229]
MSHSARLSDYRTALTTPGMRGPVVASLLARLPIAMIGLSLLLYVKLETGSFAAAGLVSAASLIGVAVGSIVQGRLMDRFGPTRPLLGAVSLFAVFVTLAVIAVEAHAPLGLLVPVAFAVGLNEPMVGSASRALWARVTPPGSVRLAGYAYEAISMEVFFILGPGLAGLLVTAPWAGTGVVIGAGSMVVGALWFALNPTVRGVQPEPATRSLLGALASPGMRTVALAALGFGVTIGFIEVAVPAAAEEAGHFGLGGLLLSLWSVSSVLFGVLYAMKPFPKAMHLRLPVLLGGFALLSLLLAVPTTLIGLGLALLVVGTLITPQATTHSAAIEQVAPAGTATEAFGWVVTAVTVGLAVGQFFSGLLVESSGTGAAFLAAAAAGLAIAALVWAFRGTVAAGVPLPRQDEVELASSR